MFQLYILQKLLSVLILLKLRSLYGILSLFIFFIIFFFKKDSYDIIQYIDEVDNYYNYEFLFSKIIYLIDTIVSDNSLVIFIYQIFLITVVYSVTFLFKENKTLIFSIVLTSVAFLLAIHNNLRQGTALLILLIGTLYFLKGYKVSSFFLILITLGFHESSVFFILLIILSGVFYHTLIFKKYLKKSFSRTSLSLFYSIILSLLCVYLILFFINYTSYKDYLGIDIVSNNPERINHFLKIFILFFYTLFIELLFKFKDTNYDLDFLRFLRLFIFFFVSLSSFLDQSLIEISNRILYFYYIVELGILCILVEKKRFIILVSMITFSACAFNVWSILG